MNPRAAQHAARLAASLPDRTRRGAAVGTGAGGPIAGSTFVPDVGVISNRHRVTDPPRASRAERTPRPGVRAGAVLSEHPAGDR